MDLPKSADATIANEEVGESFGFATVFTLAGATIGAIMVLAADIMAVRFLGVEHYGFFALAYVIAKFCGMTAAFGLRTAVIHFVPQYLHDGRSNLLVGAVVASLGLPLLLSGVFASATWLSADRLAADVFTMPPAAARYIQLTGLLIPLIALVEVLSNLPRAFGRSVEQVLVRNIVPPTTFAALLAVIMVTEARPIAVMAGLIAAHALAVALGAFFVTVLVRRYAKSAGRPVLPWRELYRFSLWIVITDFLLLGVSSGDILVLAVYVDAEQVGLYRVCVQIGAAFFLVLHAVGAAVAPAYPMLVRNGDTDELQALYGLGLRCVAIVLIPAFWLVVLNAQDILLVFDPRFGVGALVLQLRSAALVVLYGLGLSGVLLVVGGRPAVEMRIGAIGFAVSIALNFALVPQWGVTGAAAAALTTALLMTVLRVRQVRRLMGVRTLDRALLRVVVLSGVVAVAVDLLLATLGLAHGGGTLALVVRVLVTGGVVMTAVIWREVGAGERARFRRVSELRHHGETLLT